MPLLYFVAWLLVVDRIIRKMTANYPFSLSLEARGWDGIYKRGEGWLMLNDSMGTMVNLSPLMAELVEYSSEND